MNPDLYARLRFRAAGRDPLLNKRDPPPPQVRGVQATSALLRQILDLAKQLLAFFFLRELVSGHQLLLSTHHPDVLLPAASRDIVDWV